MTPQACMCSIRIVLVLTQLCPLNSRPHDKSSAQRNTMTWNQHQCGDARSGAPRSPPPSAELPDRRPALSLGSALAPSRALASIVCASCNQVCCMCNHESCRPWITAVARDYCVVARRSCVANHTDYHDTRPDHAARRGGRAMKDCSCVERARERACPCARASEPA